jgi:D-xylose transport system substrate-binding protein
MYAASPVRHWRALLALLAIAVIGAATAGLATASAHNTRSALSSSKKGPAFKIVFDMPCSTCASRFEDQDKPDFIESVHALDPSAQVIADNAQGSDASQISQVEDGIAQGAKVIVVSPLDTATGVAIVSKAAKAHIPVIAYDGLLTGAKIAFYVSFDNTLVGKLQGEYLVNHLAAGSTVAMINGDQTSATGVQFKQGALSALNPAFKSGRLKLGFTADTPQFDPSTAQTETEQALTKLNNNIQGVLSPNDGIAGGVIAALKSQNLAGKVLVTGQDATTAGLQDILLGTQAMTVFKPIVEEASTAAKVAVGLGEGNSKIIKQVAKTTVNNGKGQVPSLLLQPIVITKHNESIVVKDHGGSTWNTICSGIPASVCPSH